MKKRNETSFLYLLWKWPLLGLTVKLRHWTPLRGGWWDAWGTEALYAAGACNAVEQMPRLPELMFSWQAEGLNAMFAEDNAGCLSQSNCRRHSMMHEVTRENNREYVGSPCWTPEAEKSSNVVPEALVATPQYIRKKFWNTSCTESNYSPTLYYIECIVHVYFENESQDHPVFNHLSQVVNDLFSAAWASNTMHLITSPAVIGLTTTSYGRG